MFIAPAIAQLQGEGIDARAGPITGDTLFHARCPRRFRWAALVHVSRPGKKKLIPIKTIAFDEAVNVTLGPALPARWGGVFFSSPPRGGAGKNFFKGAPPPDQRHGGLFFRHCRQGRGAARQPDRGPCASARASPPGKA